MKKSNKLILGGFLAGLLFIAGIHITLYAKYKKGDYTLVKHDTFSNIEMKSFDGVTHVSIRYVQPAIVSFEEKAQVEVRQDVNYLQQGNTLLIFADDTTANYQMERPDRSTKISVPYGASVDFFRTSGGFRQTDSSSPMSGIISLSHSFLQFSKEPGKIFQVGNLKINASDSSTIGFTNTNVDSLSVQLTNSIFNFHAGTFRKLTILTDSISQISLPPKQLSKADIQLLPGQ
jgi:hypothetical protein